MSLFCSVIEERVQKAKQLLDLGPAPLGGFFHSTKNLFNLLGKPVHQGVQPRKKMPFNIQVWGYIEEDECELLNASLSNQANEVMNCFVLLPAVTASSCLVAAPWPSHGCVPISLYGAT